MSEEKTKLSGPDLTQGVELSTIPDGTMLLGHAHGEPVLLARRGDEVFAIGAICTHYGAPLERRAARRRYGSLPVASCLFQPAHRRGSPRAGVGPGLAAGASKQVRDVRASVHVRSSKRVGARIRSGEAGA